jgi:hypothetical protein
MIFVNLPVADVEASAAFYTALGFTRDPRFSQAGSAAAMVWSDTISVMLLSHDFYKGFLPHKAIADTRATNAVLLCLSRDSREEVDAITDAAAAAGGIADPRPAQDMGFMYGRSFEDLDGHIFEPMYMDVDAAMAAMSQPAA